MFRKSYFSILLTAALVLSGGIFAFAQTTAPVSGQIVLKKADGTTQPVADALVEVFRTDVKGKLPSDKTDKKGSFAFAGLPLGATFVLSISAPGAKPGYLPNVKAGDEKILITLVEGDGRRWTEEEIRDALTGAPAQNTPTQQNAAATADQKKAEEERARLEAEYAARKENAEKNYALVSRVLEEGKKAYDSKNYDLAIVKFEEGYKASPDFVGSAPVLLNNKGAALYNRAVDFHNQSNKVTDAAAKADLMNKSKKDFADAVDAYNTSWTILKNAPAKEIADQQLYQTNKTDALNGLKNVAKYMVLTSKIEPEKIPLVATLLSEYAAVETDAAKKAEAGVYLADMYRITNDAEKAIAAYRKVLASSPDNADALAGLGLSLANAGYNTDGSVNEAMMQEAINNLQRFTEVAPDNHKLKASVKETVDYLKSQNFKPTKKKS